MRVNEYIYRNWANWNFAILKELCEDEGIEWSEELVAYLKTTPTNTNWSLLKDFGIEPYREDEGGSDTYTVTFMVQNELATVGYIDEETGELTPIVNPLKLEKDSVFKLPRCINGNDFWDTTQQGEDEYAVGSDYTVTSDVTFYFVEPHE